jgi:type IX secretion system substrate protein
MKTFLFSLFVITTLSASAQKIRFTDPGNRWTTMGAAGTDGCPFQHGLYFGPDSIIEGHTYRTFSDDFMIVTNFPSYYGCTGAGGVAMGAKFWVREDTLAGIVYYRSDFLSADTDEHVLYNYNLNVGDSISYNGKTDSVISIDSTIINGVYHKIFNFKNRAYVTTMSYTVVEGVGCTNDPLFPAFFGGCFEYGESLLCFSQSGVHPSFHAPINSCASFSGSSMDNSSSCTLRALPVNKMSPSIVINPNPANDHLNIISDVPINGEALISVYDISGRIILHLQAELQNKLTINTTTWNEGLYMVVITNNGGIVKKEKVVVAR